MLHEGQELAVLELSSEMSRLMEEVDAEFGALLASQSPGVTTPSSPGAALERAAEAPRHAARDPSSQPSGPPSTSASASTSLALPRGSALAPLSSSFSPATGSLLALPPLARSPADVASAGGRAQRRRQNWQRAGRVTAAAQPAEAKYKAAGNNSMSLFMGSFTTERILNAEDELRLVEAATDFMQITRVTQMLGGVLRRRPSLAEVAQAIGCGEDVLSARLEYGGRARALLCQRNYRLVVHITKNVIRYMSGSDPNRGSAVAQGGASGTGAFGGAQGAGLTTSNPQFMEDAITAGMEGLTHAIQKFRADAGCRLSTYATWWIRQCVTRFVRSQHAVVSLPDSARALAERITRTRKALSAELHREPTPEEVAKVLGVTVSRLAELEDMRRTAMTGARSFEAPLSDKDEGNNADRVAPEEDDVTMAGAGSALSVDSEEHYALETELTATVDDVLSSLDLRDEEVLRQVYGLGGGAALGPDHDLGSGVALAAAAAAAGAAGTVGPAAREGSGVAAEGKQEEAGGEEQQQQAPSGQKPRSGKERLKTSVPRRGPSANIALRKLRERTAGDTRLQEWLAAPQLKSDLPARSAGYTKKT